MSKGTFAKLIRQTKRLLMKYSPEILTGIGIAGMLTTTVIAVKATPKAVRLLDERKDELEIEKLPGGEIVKTAWKCYIPAVVTATASTCCLIGASSVSFKRNAALATAYKLAEEGLLEYKRAVVETIGEKKEKIVRDKVAENAVKENPVSKNTVIVTKKGETLCYDPISKSYFKSSIDEIDRAVNKFNNQRLKDPFDMERSVNDFYYELCVDPIPALDKLGWTDELLDVYYSAQIADDEVTPCIVLNYATKPHHLD